MSTLDRIVSGMQAAQEKLRAAIASADQVGATSEAVSDIGHSVGSERHIDGGTAMAERAENGRAKLQAALDRLDELIVEAEALKTAGPSAASPASTTDTGNSAPPAEPQYEATTGADHKPTPINAVPGHLREPSRKIGDPVKPVETEVPQSNARRSARFGRKLSEGAEEVRDYTEELISSISSKAGDGIDPQGPGIRTETHTAPTGQTSTSTYGEDVSSPDVVGTLVMTGAFAIDATIRVVNRFRDNRGKRKQ